MPDVIAGADPLNVVLTVGNSVGTSDIIGDTASQLLRLSSTGGSILQWNTSNTIAVGNGTQTYQAGGTNAARISSGGMSLLKGATNPVASAALELSSTSKGFLPSRMTTTEKNAISSPATGLMVYDTTLNKLCVYTGSAWETITSV